MDLLIILIVSTTFIATTIAVTLISSKMIYKYRDAELEGDNLYKKGIYNSYETVSSGYAYTIDAGDSMVIVVVMDKKNQGNKFLNVPPLPIKIKNVKGIEDD